MSGRERVKVAHVITELNVGGAEQLLVNTVECTNRERFEPLVVALYAGNTRLADRIRAQGVAVVCLGMTAKWRVDGLWRFFRLLRRERPAILHGWLFHAIVVARIIGRIAGVPIVVSARHNVNIGGSARERVNRWTNWLDDRTIAVSESIRQVEVTRGRSSAERVVTILNGVPRMAFPPRAEARRRLRAEFDLPAQAVVLGTVARLHKQKGHAVLARAVQQLVERFPLVHCVWVGDGEEKGRLETLVGKLGISAHVRFAGSRSDVPDLLAGMDLFVLPSHWEGMPVAILEAMAAGLPVVATAVGGTPEVVEDETTGLLPPPRDPVALAEAISRLLRDPERARRMGEAGRKRVETEFSMDANVRRVEALYEQLLRDKQLRVPRDISECPRRGYDDQC
jgi:sugar transferase (PEP-CTERM/EpsH1 system associated)